MASPPDVTPDVPRIQDVSEAPSLHRHTTNSNNRYSIGSNETGESSTVGGRRSVASSSGSLGDRMAEGDDNLEAANINTNGRGSHRSHRNRSSGGFLLSSSMFDSPSQDARDAMHTPQRKPSSRDEKGKTPTRSHEKGHRKRRSNTGLGLGVRSSPLTSVVTTEETDHNVDKPNANNQGDKKAEEANATPLDVDSTQIVNLALNLSESRRTAARRSISGTTPPVGTGIRESFAGGSLRQHLQQQRRTSRNPSPKAERSDRTLSGSYRAVSGQKPYSPLNAAFSPHSNEDYQYHISPSTLARAEKAKNYIGLMVEYRRLLQYVPPLKPHAPENYPPFDSPHSSRITSPRTDDVSSNVERPLGRPYNPLQYVRNRKVRARERKAIDGEAQGFGDLAKVSTWVHDVAATALTEDYRTADCLPLPPFSKAAEVAASPHSPPPSKSQPATPKIKRPRIDWFTNPADLLADVFWLEQDDNKKIIEDHSGRKIFAGTLELKRPVSNRDNEVEQQQNMEVERLASPTLRIDTKLPDFTRTKSDASKQRERATSRAKQKLREVTRLHHGHNGSVRERPLLAPRILSDTDSSDLDGAHRPRRRSRRQTAETLAPATDILDKQMMDMLKRESAGQEWNTPDESSGQKPPLPMDGTVLSGNGSGRHTRSTSLAADNLPNNGSTVQISSGRPSLEAPIINNRVSLEELDSTAPNSPQTKATRAANSFVPSIAMDLSPPYPISPPRHRISRVKSRINPFHEHSRTRSRGRGETIGALVSAPSLISTEAETPETLQQRMTLSPVAQTSTAKSEDSSKTTGKSNLRRGRAGDESSSIIGFLKGTRGPVAKVGDFLWKRETPPILSVPPGFSSDESDSDVLRAMREKSESDGRDTSIEAPGGIYNTSAEKQSLSHHTKMPAFTSSHEQRGRPTPDKKANGATDLKSGQQAREERAKAARANFLGIPPRIDVHNASPSSSPDLEPVRRYSSVSDLESRRGSALSGVESADARLNAILGQPGHPAPTLPVTGLTALEVTHDRRPTPDSKRQWNISDCQLAGHRGPVTKREIARIQALFLSSGIKANEITRQASQPIDLLNSKEPLYSEVAKLSQEQMDPVPNSQQHILAATVLSSDIQLSSRIWQAGADNFYNSTASSLFGRAENLHSHIADNLTPRVRAAADEADELSRNILTFQSLQIKRIINTMDNMMRRRRRRFRWLRRGGWVMVEWALVGVMWFAWFLVVFVRIFLGLGTGVVRSIRWLFWL